MTSKNKFFLAFYWQLKTFKTCLKYYIRDLVASLPLATVYFNVQFKQFASVLQVTNRRSTEGCSQIQEQWGQRTNFSAAWGRHQMTRQAWWPTAFSTAHPRLLPVAKEVLNSGRMNKKSFSPRIWKQKSCSPATYCTLLSLWRKAKSTSAHDHRAVACTHELQTREVIKGRSTGESNVLLNEILLKQAQYKWVTTKIDLLFENDAWGYLHPVTGWEGQSQTRVRAAQFEGEPHCSGAPQTPASIQHQAIHDGCLLSLIIRHKQM